MITLTNISANNTNTSYTDPATALQIVGQVPIPGLVRQLRLSPNGITFFNGTDAYTVAIQMSDAWNVAVAASPNLSYAPYALAQPANANVTHPNSAMFSFSVQSELNVSYQWQYSNNGAAWANATGGVYTGDTTNTLNVSNSTGLNNYNFKCKATNVVGLTISNQATITVL
jgi:hypothetical protein